MAPRGRELGPARAERMELIGALQALPNGQRAAVVDEPGGERHPGQPSRQRVGELQASGGPIVDVGQAQPLRRARPPHVVGGVTAQMQRPRPLVIRGSSAQAVGVDDGLVDRGPQQPAA